MIEGRSGGSGRGTRRESWAPPDSGSAHRRIAGLYRVPDSRPEAVPCAALAFPSLRRFLTLAPACWPQGKIPPHPSARSARHSSPQDGGPKGKMIEGRSGGSGRGTRRELWAPPDSGSSTSGSYVVSCTDARPEPPTHFLPSAASSPSPLPAGHGEKFRRTRAHVQLGTGLRRMSGPTGKWSKGGSGA